MRMFNIVNSGMGGAHTVTHGSRERVLHTREQGAGITHTGAGGEVTTVIHGSRKRNNCHTHGSRRRQEQ